MRKALIILLALLILGAGATVYASADITRDRENVVYTELFSYGDIHAADGVSIKLHDQLHHRLTWDSDIRFADGALTAETKHEVRSAPLYEQYVTEPSGVVIMDALNSGEFLDADGDTGLGKAFEELSAETLVGEYRSKVIRLADYFDYYPLTVNIELPGLLVATFPDIMEHDRNSSPEIYAARGMMDYFRIPVLEDQYMEIHIQLSADGAIMRGFGSDERGDEFYLYTNSVIGKDTCYFWFSNLTKNGNRVDTSHIPGGYGVYALPFGYSETDGPYVLADELALLYPVDESIEIRHLAISGDKKELLLYTLENDEITLSVIDAKTGALRQKLPVAPERCGDYCWDEYRNGDDFTCIRTHDDEILTNSRILVVARNEAGDYAVMLDAPDTMYTFDVYEPISYNDSQRMEFDGKRLVIAGIGVINRASEGYIWRDSGCSFYIAVYEPEKLSYYGFYGSSLDDFRDAFAPDGDRYEHIPHPLSFDPVELAIS